MSFRKSNPPPAMARALIASLPKGVDKKTVRFCRVPRRAAAASDGRATSRSPFGAAGRCCARPGAGAVGLELGPRCEKRGSHISSIRQRPLSRAGPVPACAGKIHLPPHVTPDSRPIGLPRRRRRRAASNTASRQSEPRFPRSMPGARTADVTALKADLRTIAARLAPTPPRRVQTEAVERDFFSSGGAECADFLVVISGPRGSSATFEALLQKPLHQRPH